jgi:hypothetical protein
MVEMVCGVRWYSILLKERYMLPCNQVLKKWHHHCVCVCVRARARVTTKLKFQEKLPSNCIYTHHTPHTNFSIICWKSMDLYGILCRPVSCILWIHVSAEMKQSYVFKQNKWGVSCSSIYLLSHTSSKSSVCLVICCIEFVVHSSHTWM